MMFRIPALADLTGHWPEGGPEVFVLRQNGNAITGTIEGPPVELRRMKLSFSGSGENTKIPPRSKESPEFRRNRIRPSSASCGLRSD